MAEVLDYVIEVSEFDLQSMKLTFELIVLGKDMSSYQALVQSEPTKRNNGRLETVRLPISAGLPPGGRTALLTPSAHQAHIALSEPMSNIDQQGSSLGSFPTFPSPYPHFNRPSGNWPCVEPCLVGDIGK